MDEKEAYEETTIKATAKRLKHLQKNYHLADPESVKMFVANKKCGNAFKECLIEVYDIHTFNWTTVEQTVLRKIWQILKIPNE